MIDYKINRLMNSEHISYKSTRQYLKTSHKRAVGYSGSGENAGIVTVAKIIVSVTNRKSQPSNLYRSL